MTRPRPRRPVPIVALAAVAAVPAFALAGVWQYAEVNVPPPTTTTTTTLPPPPVDELATDLLSFRRHPTPLAERAAEAVAAAELDGRVAALTDDLPPGSCLQILDPGASAAAPEEAVVAEHDPAAPVVPASNQKLLVAAVALDVLGPEHRFRTLVESATPVDGVIPGDVYLVGGGDPVLRTAEVVDPLPYPAVNTTALEPLADQLVELGVVRIEGDVVGDGSRYDDEFRAPSWGPDITNFDAGPYDALLVDDGLIGGGNYGLEPNRAAARIFYDMLVERGISIGGAAANHGRPDGLTTLALIESEPLPEILVELLHTSDNNTAELLVKEIGVAATGQGTRQAGLDTIRERLAAWGVPLDAVVLHDGSGLSRENRVTCATLAAVVSSAPIAAELRDLLPVAGRDGTLAEQLLGTEAEGSLVAKTGTLTDVKALSGSQPGADRRRLDFALVLNGPDVDDATVYEPIWKRLVALLAGYPVEVDPDVTRFEPLEPGDVAD